MVMFRVTFICKDAGMQITITGMTDDNNSEIIFFCYFLNLAIKSDIRLKGRLRLQQTLLEMRRKRPKSRLYAPSRN